MGTSSLRGRVIGRAMARTLASLRGIELSPDTTTDDLARYIGRQRPRLDALAARGRLPRGARLGVVGRDDADEVVGEWMAARGVGEDDRVVMHLHGGAYVLCSPATHRTLVHAISLAAGARVFTPRYRLAPDHPCPAAIEDAVAAYRWLLEEEGVDPRRLAVTGDSAGGGLGVAMLVQLREEGLPMPACWVGLSPWADLTASSASIAENNGRDALFGVVPEGIAPRLGELYAGGLPTDDPRVSPVYADLTGLPPMLVHVGADELIRDDGLRLVAAAREHGVDASAGIFRGMWHVFQIFPIPETRASLQEIGGFVRRHTRTHAGSLP